MNTIQEKWMQYQKVGLPKNAGPGQTQDVRNAFYAGAMSVLQLALKAGSEDSEVVGAMMMETLHEEIIAYAKGLKR